ncbi:MAG: Gfo/Idh/MocA family oxidoreductase [Candidatus Gottesmanbacteria bacterium]
MKKRLRIAVVGCGYFGLKRIRACLDIQSVATLVGVVDTNKPLAKQIGTQFSVHYATSISALKQTTPVDAVIIATPNAYHAPCVIEALAADCHVLCEKPLAPSFIEAKKIMRAAKKYHRFVKTGSNHRFFPAIQKIHELIQLGVVGKVLLVKGSIGTNGSHTEKSWFWKKDISGGGTYIDNACHLLDITRWIMGDFSTCVGAIGNTYWKHTTVEDVACGTYKTYDGRFATIASSWTQWVGYISFEVWGDKGYALIDSKQNNRVIVGSKDSKKQKIYDFSHKPISSYQDELRYFVSCILNNKQPLPSANDGAAVIQMIEAVYTSAKTKRSVRLSTYDSRK